MSKPKFLVDENIPRLVQHKLIVAGYDAAFFERGASDIAVAKAAKRSGRVLLTLDNDFANTVLFPPSEYNILQVAIHPPEKNSIAHALTALLNALPPSQFKGLIIVTKDGFTRVEK